MTDKERVVQDVKTHDIFKSIKSQPSSNEFSETQNHEEQFIGQVKLSDSVSDEIEELKKIFYEFFV